MTQTIGPLDQAFAHGNRQVLSTVYQEFQAFFVRIDRWTTSGESLEHGVDEHVLVGPLSALASLLTRERDAVEAVRKGRAEAVLAYLRLRPAVRGEPELLAPTVRGWRQNERSIGVQRILDEALKRI